MSVGDDELRRALAFACVNPRGHWAAFGERVNMTCAGTYPGGGPVRLLYQARHIECIGILAFIPKANVLSIRLRGREQLGGPIDSEYLENLARQAVTIGYPDPLYRMEPGDDLEATLECVPPGPCALMVTGVRWKGGDP